MRNEVMMYDASNERSRAGDPDAERLGANYFGEVGQFWINVELRCKNYRAIQLNCGSEVSNRSVAALTACAGVALP